MIERVETRRGFMNMFNFESGFIGVFVGGSIILVVNGF